MYYNLPKLIMRVDLVGEKNIELILISVNRYFVQNAHIMKSFFSKDDFMIYASDKFIAFKGNVIGFPKNFEIGKVQKATITLDSDEKRHEYLKLLNRALLEWSKSNFWKNYNDPKRVRITYSNKVWIVF